MKKIVLLILLSLSISKTTRCQTTVVDSFMYEGVWRNYRLFLPNGFSSGTSLPLVFNLHGYTSNALEQELYSGFNNVADTGNFLVCYPNGINNSWNVLSGTPNDVGFIDTLISVLQFQYNINTNRVYSTGLSNGGFMSNLLACSLSQKIAAIAPVAGPFTFYTQTNCSPGRHVPVLYIHGTADPVVNYNGDLGYNSASDLMSYWANNNNCSMSIDTFALSDVVSTDGCTAEKISWLNCSNDGDVIHYRIINGGHTWPGSPFNIGITNQDFNASAVIWEFFNRFSLTSSMDEISNTKFASIQENPFHSNLKIRLPDVVSSQVMIYSTDGKLLHSENYFSESIEIKTEWMSSGIYILNVRSGKQVENFRIVKLN